VARWTLTLRNGSRVERTHFEDLDAALSALEARIEELAPEARVEAVEVLKRRYDPARQVAVRGEVAGPSRYIARVRGGIDLRGDGSTEAFTGHWRRTLVGLRSGESAYDGLRRALGVAAG
jgi:hypothetical protein